MNAQQFIAAVAVVTGLSIGAVGAPSAAPGATHDSASVKKAASHVQPAAVPAKQIYFFMNPNGRPCQMQLGIINGMKDKLAPLATVTYVKTTESTDRDKFGTFGIRGLPTLIILDKGGKELKRLLPGIQDESAILAALQ